MNSHAVLQNIKFVTGNPNKVREAGEILGVALEQVNLPDLHEIQTHDLEDIIRDKTLQAYQAVNAPVLVEDSGLLFSAWNGLPGALVKWFETTVGCDGLLKMLEPFDDREAFALCYVGYHDGKEIKTARGRVKGRVADRIAGEQWVRLGHAFHSRRARSYLRRNDRPGKERNFPQAKGLRSSQEKCFNQKEKIP